MVVGLTVWRQTVPYVRYYSEFRLISHRFASLRIASFSNGIISEKLSDVNYVFRIAPCENTVETTSDHFFAFFPTYFLPNIRWYEKFERKRVFAPISNDFNYLSVDTHFSAAIKCAGVNCVDFNFNLVIHRKSHLNFSVLACFTVNNDVIIIRLLLWIMRLDRDCNRSVKWQEGKNDKTHLAFCICTMGNWYNCSKLKIRTSGDRKQMRTSAEMKIQISKNEFRFCI